MPRLFRVYVEKRVELLFVAEDEEELEDALSDADFDDWNCGDWETRVIDLFDPAHPRQMAEIVVKPDMAVHNGVAVNIDDYVPDNPDYLALLKVALDSAKAAAAKLEEPKAEPPADP